MTAHDQVRAMLDELMGTNRDGDSKRSQVKFDDPRVCKSFLLGCCPHDILASTRMDLGECKKHHDLALRADYETAQRIKDHFYDIDSLEHLQSFIAECDRKTEIYKRRLKETQEELSEDANSKAELIHSLGEEIGTKLASAEAYGADGKVEESMTLLQEVEELKKRKNSEEQEYKNSMPASSYQQQKLRVCEICSAYLGIHDNDRRLADHFGGKLHLGFITIRDKLADLQSKHAERIQERGAEREKQRVKREEERQKEEEERGSRRRRSRSRSRRRSRSRSKDRRRRSKSRSRSRTKRRSRSRSRSRHSKKSRRRSRSHSRSRRSRSRSRKRSRRTRTRSRSRSRRHRSRSRSRDKRSHSHKKSRRSRSRSRSHSRRSGSHDHEQENGEAKSRSPSAPKEEGVGPPAEGEGPPTEGEGPPAEVEGPPAEGVVCE